MEDRLIELEMRISYQDKMIDDLNSVVTELRQQIEKIEQKYGSLDEVLGSANVKDASLEETPPHY